MQELRINSQEIGKEEHGISEILRSYSQRFKDLLKDLSPSKRKIFNLRGSLRQFFLSLIDERFIWIDSNEESARRFFQDALFYRRLFGLKTDDLIFVPSGDDPYSEGIRSEILFNKRAGSLFCSEEILDIPFWNDQVLKKDTIHLKKGMEIERLKLVDNLIKTGYRKATIVINRGEFCLRSFALEVYPSTGDSPLRIEFFGDEIESIKIFDVETQKSVKEIEEFRLFPAGSPERGTGFSEFLRVLNLEDALLFIDEEVSGSDRLPENSVVLSSLPFGADGIDGGGLSLTGLGLLYNERKSIDELPEAIKPLLRENSVIISTRTPSQAKRLKDIFFEKGIVIPLISISQCMRYDGRICLLNESPSSGIHLSGLMILSEQEIFGPVALPYRQYPGYRLSRIFNEVDDLEEGDFVVHKVHGIGIYRGVQRLKVEDVIEDLLIIEYSNGARLLLPVRNISMVHKFRAQEGVIPRIDSIGGKTWKRTKEKVQARIKETAERLIKLYAEREISIGHAFSPEGELHREFASFFEYRETPDQLRAIEETINDMESPRPMERLIVGDVGFGKTEVAMRAAFKAVYDHKQVAVLVPTTLLCEQHLRNFKERFSAFPVRIDYLSRLKSPAEQKRTIEALAMGEIDIIIGTHALLSEKIKFLDLGLLIIDEEHRFGVKHKERLKELKKGVDVLVLTATPIPRTLQMALSGLRSMSIIETPPEERYAVKTIISAFDREIIKKAIEHELHRGGQVFFVHNRIKDIEEIKRFVEDLVPGAKVAIAHGEMDEKLTEDMMLAFIDKKIDILVCTNIIGSGIDIPSANTIIINRAHEMGLADLYQLRGRVGRSNVRAYCYLLIPGNESLTEAAKKRLEAISELSYLGAGIRLAMTDLEIRGAGNLLGKEQSGHINTVGFELYSELLEKAIRELKGESIEEEIEPVIEVSIPARIPEEYVEDIHLRMSLYRRLSMTKTTEEIEEIEEEIRDRFGDPPDEVRNLFEIIRAKIFMKRADILRIGSVRKGLEIEYRKEISSEEMNRILEILRGSGIPIASLGNRKIVLSGDNKRLLFSRFIDVMSRAYSGKESPVSTGLVR
ncbi:MAG: transcription-repair coupling factor [Thermodesulfovibrionales bacterium]|nr:transcription-repair coupling factor [Thermodesulfovibrionales bacterium]